MSDLQKIVVLCFFGTLLVGAAVLVAPLFLFQNAVSEPSTPQERPPISDETEVPPTPPIEAPEELPVLIDNKVIDSFDDCVAAGNPVMESYPEQCRANGVTFVNKRQVVEEEPVACTEEAKMCPDGSAVGREGPNCEFALCPGEETPGEEGEGVYVCTKDDRMAQICTMEYMPVCGLTEVQCITEPCDPVPQTYGNGCSACASGSVISYTQGECSA